MSLTADGKKLEAQHAASLKSLEAKITHSLPSASVRKKTDLQHAGEAVMKAEADAAQKSLGRINGAKVLVEHAKGKWIGGLRRASPP